MAIPAYGGRTSSGGMRDIESERTQKWRPTKYVFKPIKNPQVSKPPDTLKKPDYSPQKEKRGPSMINKLASTVQNAMHQANKQNVQETVSGLEFMRNKALPNLPGFKQAKPLTVRDLGFWGISGNVQGTPPIPGMGGTGAVQYTPTIAGMGGTGATQYTHQIPGMGGTGAVEKWPTPPGAAGPGMTIDQNEINNRKQMANYFDTTMDDAASRRQRIGAGVSAIVRDNEEWNKLSDLEKNIRRWADLDRGYSKVENIRAQRGNVDIELPPEEPYPNLPAYDPGYSGGGGGGGGWGGGGPQQYPDWFEKMYSWRF